MGIVEDIAFKLIRKRQFPGLPKIHQIIRNLPKYLSHEEAKDAIFALSDIEFALPEENIIDQDGNEYDERQKDRIWGNEHATVLIKQMKKASDLYERRKDKETPIKLLDDALKKLLSEDMRPDIVPSNEIAKGLNLSEQIEKEAEKLRREFYYISKNKN